MKLIYAGPSPYSRKVRVVIAEKGLGDEIQFTACNPFEDAPDLRAANPLGKVPVLVLDDGTVLFDSPIICEYLDGLGNGHRLLPEGVPGWTVRRRHALADGLLDAAFNIVIERRRPESERSASWIERWGGAIDRVLARVDAEVGDLGAEPTLAHIAFGCALGYLDFRLPDRPWRDKNPKAAAWFSKFSERPSMAATKPA